MKEISRRDYFAANADVGWMKDATIDFASARTGVNKPADPANEQQVANFWTKAEIMWRWRYADLMIKGS